MKHHSWRAARALAAGLAIGSAALAIPAGSQARAPSGGGGTQATKTVSFSGSCTFSGGTVNFSPGLNLDRETHTDTVSANGPCSGNQTAKLSGTLTGPANCAGGEGPAQGTGTLTVNGTAIPVKIVMTLTLPNGTITISGTSSGSASGSAKFANPGNLGAMPSCAGSGLKSVSFYAAVKTGSAVTSSVAAPTVKKPVKKKKKH